MGVQQVPQEQQIIVTVELAPEGASDTWACDIRWCSGGVHGVAARAGLR